MQIAHSTRTALRLTLGTLLATATLSASAASQGNSALSYPIVDTGVTEFYSDSARIHKPAPGSPFFGQDAQYQINPPSYRDNGDGTVTDLVTGLTWQQEMGEKMTLAEAKRRAARLNLGGYSDWRVPSIKELYSLIQFTGRMQRQRPVSPYIDSDYFPQPLGDSQAGERSTDAQTWSTTEYVGRTMRNDRTVFGVNFVDGRIKGYPKYEPRTGQAKKMYVRFVRGNPEYGKNQLIDNGDGTISDLATGLMWQKNDSGRGMDWSDALGYANRATTAGYSDWRLPSAKELQSIVDYSRSPQTTASAAISPLFRTSQISNPGGGQQFPYFWTSTTHLDGRNPYSSAVYIAFGEALGKMGSDGGQRSSSMARPESRVHGPNGKRPPHQRTEQKQSGEGRVLDVHGAGAQRSDPKSGSRSSYPQYVGPQGDLRRVYNYARAVRNIEPITTPYRAAH